MDFVFFFRMLWVKFEISDWGFFLSAQLIMLPGSSAARKPGLKFGDYIHEFS